MIALWLWGIVVNIHDPALPYLHFRFDLSSLAQCSPTGPNYAWFALVINSFVNYVTCR